VLWTPNLAIGVEMIDEQHKEWFKRAEELFEAGRNRRSKEYIGEMLDFLDEYTKKHFADEEKFMESINYPELDAQKKAHSYFIDQLAKLKADYEESGSNILVILNANQLVGDWLINHISKMDKKIGEFVANRG
jgi:hemerythrin